MNRIQAASSGYSEMVEYTLAGWVVVGIMFTLAFFLIGYLILSASRRAKREKRRRTRKDESMSPMRKKKPKP